jgi:cell division protein FtsW (lipid II flippase)
VGNVTAAFTARERNLELFLLVAALGFAIIGEYALQQSPATLPGNAHSVVIQFAATVLLGHFALRLAAPRASLAVYASAALLSAIGLVVALRLSVAVDEVGLARDQANWISIGVALMAVTALLGRRYELLTRFRYTAAAMAILLLLLTGLIGEEVNGARLWISIAGQNVQTTELIKVLVIIFLAGYLAREAPVLSVPPFRMGALNLATGRFATARRLLPLLVALGAAMGVLLLIKDLGSIAILLLFSAATLYVATGRALYIILSLGALFAVAIGGYFLVDHAQTRIETWLDPYADADVSGYQSLQAIYAIEAGGITGEGLGMGQPQAIPAATTDYVFAAIGEELGLAGAFGVTMVYLLFLVAALRSAMDAPDRFGRLLAASIGLLIAIQAAVIIAGNLRLIPTTGITLPFVSYGGSSVVVNFILVGLLAAVSHRAAMSQRSI